MRFQEVTLSTRPI